MRRDAETASELFGTTELLPRPSHSPNGIRIESGLARPPCHELRGGAIVLGSARDCDFVLPKRTVSRRHLQLSLETQGVQVTDLGSTNGTRVGGALVDRLLLTGDATILLGDVPVRLSFLANKPRPGGVWFGRYGGLADSVRGVVDTLARSAASDISLLIEGETGTGKEVVAREVHAQSSVSRGPFVAINCGSLDRLLARSELFGHSRGAFTGAGEARCGILEQADGGTLFLDEIGELPLDVQPLLLRALETGISVRLGESRERRVRLRVVSATNVNLDLAIKNGRFRGDLYYRLAGIKVQLPSLRDRIEDIAHLAQSFAQEFGVYPLEEPVLTTLKNHAWPGNVRELRHAVRGYSVLRTLSFERGPGKLNPTNEQTFDLALPYRAHKQRMNDQFLSAYLDVLLAHTQGNQSEAARISGLDRSHLNRLIARRRG